MNIKLKRRNNMLWFYYYFEGAALIQTWYYLSIQNIFEINVIRLYDSIIMVY